MKSSLFVTAVLALISLINKFLQFVTVKKKALRMNDRRLNKNLFKNYLTLSLLVVRCWAGGNTDLYSNSNISKSLRVNVTPMPKFLKEYSISFLMISRLINFALVAF